MTFTVPQYDVLDEVPGRGTLVVAVGGVHDGAVFLLVDDTHRAAPVLRSRRAGPRAVACRLLESLLDDRQLRQWQARRRIEVPTARGTVVLGQLYDLRLLRPGGDDLSLCVVPEAHRELPEEDVWVNLLLVLRSDPDRFFAVANWRDRSGTWHRGPVPVSTVSAP